ncbi:MAG: exosortase [Syntrophorhabdaceae bacterium]|nr:exosortase [Syntrophorhabdaceae bacterium]
MTIIYLFCYIFIIFFVGLLPFNFFQENRATLTGTSSGLKIETPGIAYTKAPPVKLAGMKEFTIALHLSSYLTDWTSGYARILTYSEDGNRMNFMIGQWDESLILRIKADNWVKTIQFETERFFNKYRTTWAVIVYDGKNLTSYRNGTKIKQIEVGRLSFNGWDRTYPLVIGSEANGKNCWAGYIYSIAIFDRAFSPGEVATGFDKVKPEETLLFYDFKDQKGYTLMDTGRGRAADLTIPKLFRPYKRTVFDFEYGWLFEHRHYLVDLWIDIVGFIPLGFLLASYLTKKRFRFIPILLYTILLGFVVSFLVEFFQIFLYTRTSSLIDVISNSIGALIGAILYNQTIFLRRRFYGFGIYQTESPGSLDSFNRIDYMQKIVSIDNRHILFLLGIFIGLSMFYQPLRDLMRIQYESESYLHIILIPLISGYLIYERWGSLVSKFSYSLKPGAIIMLLGIASFFFIKKKGYDLNKNDYTAFITLSACIFMLGTFLLLYGWETFKNALFPFLFILFIIPIPTPILYALVEFLQYGSTQFCRLLFTVMGIPFQQYGYIFILPNNLAVEIGDPCSGIHSTIALIIVSILGGHFFLKKTWKKILLVLFVFPLAIVKNGVRIVTLSLLGAYVDERILTQGFLHRSGGILFYIPALILFFIVLFLLRKTDQDSPSCESPSSPH